MYIDVWNRSETLRKSKISQGVKPDYHDRVSNSSTFADIVNFLQKTVKYFTKCYCIES